MPLCETRGDPRVPHGLGKSPRFPAQSGAAQGLQSFQALPSAKRLLLLLLPLPRRSSSGHSSRRSASGRRSASWRSAVGSPRGPDQLAMTRLKHFACIRVRQAKPLKVAVSQAQPKVQLVPVAEGAGHARFACVGPQPSHRWFGWISGKGRMLASPLRPSPVPLHGLASFSRLSRLPHRRSSKVSKPVLGVGLLGLSAVAWKASRARIAQSRARSPKSTDLWISKCHRCFEGTVFRCNHYSTALGGLDARFSVYVPDANRMQMTLPYPEDTEEFPVVLFLSDMGCSDLEVLKQGNALEHCASCGLILVAADTSPRGPGVADEAERKDVGIAASYYVNATQSPWNRHYRMRDYLENELLKVVHANFPTCGPEWVSAMGHGMGGMGALALAIRNPERFRSVSALAPICHPSEVRGVSPDVQGALSSYLGKDKAFWRDYDPVCLMQDFDLNRNKRHPPPILLDVGCESKSSYVQEVVKAFDFINACQQHGIPADLRLRAGYDHSFFFVASVMEEHIDFHAKHLDDA